MIVYVSIGNSDDKLSQAKWAAYWDRVDSAIARYAPVIHGVWASLPNETYQNACWCVGLFGSAAVDLKARLADLARDFGQDAITWAVVCQNEFIKPTEEES